MSRQLVAGAGLALPKALMDRQEFTQACADRDFGALFTLAKRHGVSQVKLASAVEMTASRVSEIMRGRRQVTSIEVIERVSDRLRIPGPLLGLAPRPWETAAAKPPPRRSDGRMTVTPAEHVAPSTATDTVDSVLELGRDDLERRRVLRAGGGYALGVLAAADMESLTRRTAAARAGRSVTVGRGEVRAVTRMTGLLGDAAAELGGGHARHLAVRYLVQDVARWLDGVYTEPTGRELFAATSGLVHLAGWMASDEGEQGLAQRYYGHAYRLATEAGHAELAATALRGMAVQAIDLGCRAAAVRLAEASVERARSVSDPRAIAYYHTTLANAAACDADRTAATTSLARARTAIDRAGATPGESWAAHYSPGRWAHDAGMILARLGDADAAVEHLQHALRVHGLDRQRTQAIVLADLGQVHLRRGDVDQALATWAEFLNQAAGVRSTRVTTALAEMRARLSALPPSDAASELADRAARVRES